MLQFWFRSRNGVQDASIGGVSKGTWDFHSPLKMKFSEMGRLIDYFIYRWFSGEPFLPKVDTFFLARDIEAGLNLMKTVTKGDMASYRSP